MSNHISISNFHSNQSPHPHEQPLLLLLSTCQLFPIFNFLHAFLMSSQIDYQPFITRNFFFRIGKDSRTFNFIAHEEIKKPEKVNVKPGTETRKCALRPGHLLSCLKEEVQFCTSHSIPSLGAQKSFLTGKKINERKLVLHSGVFFLTCL